MVVLHIKGDGCLKKVLKYILYYFILALVLVPILDAIKIDDATKGLVVTFLPIVLLVAIPRLWKLAFDYDPTKKRKKSPYAKRIIISASIYIIFVFLALIIANDSWPNSARLIFIFFMPFMFAIAFWCFADGWKKRKEEPEVEKEPFKSVVAAKQPDQNIEEKTKSKPSSSVSRLFPKPAEEKLPEENHDSQFIRLRQYREKLQAYSEKLKNRNEELDKRKEELDKKEKLLKRYERVLKNEEDRILSTAKAIKTEEQMERYEQQLHLLERRVFDWVRLREKDESAAFEELRNKVEVFVRAQDALPEEMTGLEFEQYFSGLLVKNGYTNVKVTKKTGDFGADVIADLGGVKYAFQCKYYTAPVGFEAVYQIHAAKTMYGAHVAVVATNSVFTKPAQIAAEELKVLLWDGGKLSQLAAEKS